MKLLLDTCTFLWWAGKSEHISLNAKAALADADNELFLSAVSSWEILVSHMRGKKLPLHVPSEPEHYFSQLRQRVGAESLPITETTTMQLPKLPLVHKDPFDRLLICQAIEHGLILVTPDKLVSRYPIRTLW